MKLNHACLRAILAAAAAFVLSGTPRPASSQTGPPFCALRDVLADMLRRNYGEALRIRATEDGGRLIEIYVSPLGSWTLLVTQGRIGCVGAAGKDWAEVDGSGPTPPDM